MMLVVNPFTGQTLVANHPGHPDQSVHGKRGIAEYDSPEMQGVPKQIRSELQRMSRILRMDCEANPRVCYDLVAEAARTADSEDEIVFLDNPSRSKITPTFDHAILSSSGQIRTDSYKDRRNYAEQSPEGTFDVEYDQGRKYREVYRMPVSKLRTIAGLD